MNDAGNGCSDHELMRRTAHGDWSGFEALVHRWQQPVTRILARMADRRDDVNDLAQEVFLRVLRGKDRYQAIGSFSTWLYRIALNVARDAARRRRWHWKPLDGEHLDRSAMPAENAACTRELAERVVQSVESLPHRLREVITLRHYGGLTCQEIADVLGKPKSTVTSQLTAAIEKLRVELEKRGVDSAEP